MLSVIRRLLVLLLVVSLPVQGWAASRMSVEMAAAAAVKIDVAVGHHTGHGHHLASDGAVTPQAHVPADCCAGHGEGQAAAHAAHSADGSHTGCGESCHCCISMALPAMLLNVAVQNPPADWYRVADCAFTQVSAPTPDKPPKG